MKLNFATLALMSVIGTASAADNLVVNGSFETSDNISGDWALFDNLQGWSREGAKFEIQKQSLGIAVPQDGNQYLELDSTANYTIYQNIPTTAGKKYKVSFYYSPRVINNDSTNRARAWFGDNTLVTMNATTRGWTKYEYTVEATGSSTQLRFQGLGTSDSYGALLDNIVVTEEEEVTPPEPPVTCKLGVYGINNFGENSNSYVYKFDMVNGTYAYVDGVANTASNIAAHNGALYFMEQNDSASKASSLWKVSLDSAEQTLAANAVSWPLYRSAVTPDGTKLLASSKTYLYEFDMQTGAKTVLGKLSYAGDDFSHGDIAYSADTNMIYVLTGKALYTLDKGDMTLDLVGEHGVNWASGLAVSSDGTLYVSGRNSGEDAKIYTLNPNTAQATFVMDGPEHINDLTYVANYCE
ncbi:DUF642 domain-containing protein [Pseudoalteromonas maricaloris]|uniref:DUF642 domain-containing protein n=1 Tax=Pseudoalteromonas maricaloris TaxID=184924 RepID=UPI000580405B|nr:DUF642 domain-containing protein [Pseudoalteromonas flavipulchra]KID35402.1 hemolysin-type calcium-binding protein [Pseudoalteromonas flavipulchra NCIMB 2033 = ATCC BAA-314]MBD0780660.1 DUF642 domain-containing protein [Pseudoalteromonas flavipulchra]MBE0375452.1 hypothetical protein [Pseudoalteromonas flavipulchra NCIMB 2033 = ATCC BAA-314]